MMPDDPWSTLEPPSDSSRVSARRIDDDIRWDFFWGRDHNKRALLILRHSAGASIRQRLPQLKGLELFSRAAESDGLASVVVALLDQKQRELFRQLCEDIVHCTAEARTELEAVDLAIGRTWRWHHLLRGGRGSLSTEQQKGLLGELLTLQRVFLPAMPVAEALDAWKGPLGAAKDFSFHGVGVESKATGATNASEVRVNSEHQLDNTGLSQLFLQVWSFEHPEGDEESFSLSEVAEGVRMDVAKQSVASVQRFDSLMAAAGFRPDDDYSKDQWVVRERRTYRVEGEFPRIVPQSLAEGLGDLRYCIDVNAIEEFAVEDAAIPEALVRVRDAR